jgi:hypothetical protein
VIGETNQKPETRNQSGLPRWSFRPHPPFWFLVSGFLNSGLPRWSFKHTSAVLVSGFWFLVF